MIMITFALRNTLLYFKKLDSVYINKKWDRIIHITGVILMVIGAIDPLEGSAVIAAGSLLLTFWAVNNKHRLRNWYLASCTMIVVGVAYMFFISSLGGFLGNTGRQWWWGLPIAPYPIGWILMLTLLLTNWFRKRADKH